MVTTEYNSPQTIFDNLHSAVIVIGENLKICCMNPAAEMLLHISNNRASNKRLDELIIDEPEFIDRLQRSLVSSHPYTVYDDQLFIHNHTTLEVDYSVSPIQYKPTGRYLLLEFIRLKARQKYFHEDSIINQYEASKSLLRGLAHEIKNPLGGIRGAAQLLEREFEQDNTNKQFTQIIINETDRLKNLLDRMVEPRDIPTKTNINIHRILEHVRQLVGAENDQVSFISDYDPSVPDICADESMMIQVILNITRNAVTAVTENSTQATIKFRTRIQRNCKIGQNTYPLAARIDIEDNGTGVAKELEEKIFMPMITGHAEGTGLGLSIAQTLVQQHNGLIEFTSRPNKTVFTILLPITHLNGIDK
ncbi:MAG: nitrogen regulation protein NR(II) [Gammaproteobacteria bacterium]|nr:nitrogen regulation protein NR(II) [Gammaproteobacteria bacterium]